MITFQGHHLGYIREWFWMIRLPLFQDDNAGRLDPWLDEGSSNIYICSSYPTSINHLGGLSHLHGDPFFAPLPTYLLSIFLLLSTSCNSCYH